MILCLSTYALLSSPLLSLPLLSSLLLSSPMLSYAPLSSPLFSSPLCSLISHHSLLPSSAPCSLSFSRLILYLFNPSLLLIIPHVLTPLLTSLSLSPYPPRSEEHTS